MKKKIVIIGALGYIGTELCKIYSGVSWHHKIIVIDNRFISERVNQIRNWNMNFVHGDILDKDLIKEGLNVQRLINYSVSHVKDLSSDFLSELKKKIPDIIYIYSQNSAVSFLNLIKKYELDEYWMKTNLMCIGEKTSSVLNELKWKKIFLFNPGEEEFLLYKI